MTKSSNDWYELIRAEGILLEIADPIGWDNTDLNKSFREKISFKEFEKKLLASVIYYNDPMKIDEILTKLRKS